MKIECYRALCAERTDRQTDRQTDRVTPWAPIGAKNILNNVPIIHIYIWNGIKKKVMFTIDIWSAGDSLSITWWLVPVSGRWGGDGESRTHRPLGTMVSPDNRWGEMTNQASLSLMGRYLIRWEKCFANYFCSQNNKSTFCDSLIHNGVNYENY